MRRHRIAGGGGVGLHVVDAGPEEAPAIVLVHGWSQHHLSWSKQLSGALTERFRVIAFDLRGHGASDKPGAAEAYQTSRLWAEDVASVIGALGLVRPVLVGWSMGGWIVQDYLRHFGAEAVGGVVFTGTSPRIGRHADPAVVAMRKPDVRAEGMYSEDQGRQVEAAIAFVKACVASPLSKRDLAFMVGLNMLTPPKVRRAARMRDEDWRADLGGLDLPALVIHGAAERVCLKPMFEEMAAAIPGTRAIVYPGAGHAPFWELPARFDADLVAFADEAHGGVA